MKRSKIIYGGIIGAILVGVIIAYLNIKPSEESSLTKLLLTDDLSLGSSSAKITVVEFGDYRCIHCARFNMVTEDMLISEYVDTGKIKFTFRDFPVNDRGNDKASATAAAASYCAADQGKYWEYHDKIFSNFDFKEGKNILTIDKLVEFASDVGIDRNNFEECLKSGKYSSRVSENAELARSLGVNSTPTFIILSGESEVDRIIGFNTIDVFRERLDKIFNNI